MRTLIAIPVFNEIKHVDLVLSKVLSFHKEVLLVDDGSTDGTAEKLETRLKARGDIRLLRHEGNRGYGQSLIDAFAYAEECRFDWVLTMDCDEQHEPERIPSFLSAISQNRADIISGTRYKSSRTDNDSAPQDRAAINACLTRLLGSLYPLDLTDSFCGFKAHRVSAMKRLNLTETGYAFPMQLWPQVVNAGLRVSELSVRRIYNDPNRSFGARLDQPIVRLTHYLDVLAIEHLKLFGETLDLPDARDLLSGRARMPQRSAAATGVPPYKPSPAACTGCCCR